MTNNYSFSEVIKNIISFFYTKVFYGNARLIRLPFYVRGRKLFEFGNGFTTGYNCRIEMFDIQKSGDKILILGVNCKIGDYVHIAAGEKIVIGDNCLIASKVYISDITHGDYSGAKCSSSPLTPPDERMLITKPVIIGKNVWIGENVCILPGAIIGNGCIIGANSIVNKNIPDNSIAVGNPARIIKKYMEETKVWVKL